MKHECKDLAEAVEDQVTIENRGDGWYMYSKINISDRGAKSLNFCPYCGDSL